jgi:hypothetical protein
MPLDPGDVGRLTDDQLEARLRAVTARERAAYAKAVALLAELDTRDAVLRTGFGSLFVYCRDALGLSEADACQRIAVARVARRFPVVVTLLAKGSITPAAVRLLAACLTSENHRNVLESARGKRKAEVEEIVARLAPRPDVPDEVRRLRPPVAGLAAPRPAPPPGPAWAAIDRLSPSRYRLEVTIDEGAVEKLRLARDMLRHLNPPGADGALIDRAFAALLADLARRKFAATARPRSTADPTTDSRYVPAEVRRRVWLRDLGRCAFVGEGGRRCEERALLEFHHVKPYAVGGEATVENIQLRCRRHNQYEARVAFERPACG